MSSKRQRGDLDGAGIDVDAEEVVLQNGGRNVARIPDRRLGGPAGLPGVLDLVEVHAVEEAKGVLAEVHRAAGRIKQRDVPGALERSRPARPRSAADSGSFSPVRGHKVIGDRLVGRRGPPATEAAPSARGRSPGASGARAGRACCRPAPSPPRRACRTG